MVEFDQRSVHVNGLDITYLVCGSGPLAICLHGFPDTPSTWRHLAPELAERGYTVVMPWLRGYAPTGVAPDGSYQTAALVTDVFGLHDALGGESGSLLVGHDWGALVAYGAAVAEPDRWQRVVTMAVPPIPALASSFFDYDQIKRSFYMFFFQTLLAETAVMANDFKFITRLWHDWSPGYDAEKSGDLAAVRLALAQPENTHAAVEYYRAMFDPSRSRPEYADLQAASAGIPPHPTLYLHGSHDGCLDASLATGLTEMLAPGSRHVVVEGAGHFLQLEKPHEVNRHVLEFVSE